MYNELSFGDGGMNSKISPIWFETGAVKHT